MIIRTFLNLSIFLCLSVPSWAQDLSDHRWKNRLVLIFSDHQDQPLYLEQIVELSPDPTGIADRKLLIYRFVDHKYVRGLTSQAWMEAEDLYDQYSQDDSEFTFILIGLDGGIKARKSEVMTLDSLFAIIDAMPMRQQELQNRKQ